MTDRQVEGVVALTVIAALIKACVMFLPSFSVLPVAVSCLKSERGPIAVSLTSGEQEKGIYFLPQGAKITDLLIAAGMNPQKFDQYMNARILTTGDNVRIDGQFRYTLGRMKASQALALDLPLDINSLSLQELVLVPGIGEKTAAQIVALREAKGAYGVLEELMEIKGIKEKKFAALKKYFFIEKHP